MKEDKYLNNLFILVVDDKRSTREALKYDLEKTFHDVTVHLASTTSEAHECVHKAVRAGRPYDVAILDFKLPFKAGDNPESTFGLRGELLEMSAKTAIIHISAFGDDPELQQFGKFRSQSSPENWTFVSKDGDWAVKVIEEIPRAIHTRRVRKEFEALFKENDADTNQLMRTHLKGGSDSARSLDVAEFCADASNHWVDLHPKLQEDLKEALGYANIDGGHVVGVMDQDAAEDEEP